MLTQGSIRALPPRRASIAQPKTQCNAIIWICKEAQERKRQLGIVILQCLLMIKTVRHNTAKNECVTDAVPNKSSRAKYKYVPRFVAFSIDEGLNESRQ